MGLNIYLFTTAGAPPVNGKPALRPFTGEPINSFQDWRSRSDLFPVLRKMVKQSMLWPDYAHRLDAAAIDYLAAHADKEEPPYRGVDLRAVRKARLRLNKGMAVFLYISG
jgi:hypothetical protein